LARQLPGYGEVVFPHCGCDARKEGHVVPSLGYKAFRLQACKEDGSVEVIESSFVYLSFRSDESVNCLSPEPSISLLVASQQ
jgi:hypothetical protein